MRTALVTHTQAVCPRLRRTLIRDSPRPRTEEASRRLRREVNMHRVSVEAWEARTGDPFLTSVRERPLVQLNLDLEPQ